MERPLSFEAAPKWAASDTLLQPRVDRLAFERKHGENAFVDAAKRLAGNETVEGFQPLGELADGERALGAQPPFSEPHEVFGGVIVGTIDDAQVIAAAALDGRLQKKAWPFVSGGALCL